MNEAVPAWLAQHKLWLPALRSGSGGEVYVTRLAAALERAGLACQVDWFDRRYEFAPFLLRGTPVPPGCTLVLANAWNGYAFRRAGLPLVVTEHHCVFDPDYARHQSFLQRLYHRGPVRWHVLRSLAAADAVVAVSQATADGLHRAGVVQPVEVLHNWVDVRLFHPAPRAPASPRPFRLLYVGNMGKRKGADRLPAIMRELGPGFELRYTGGLRGGTLRSPEVNMVSIGRPTDDELAGEYRQADALLCPSRFEGFGYSAVEAMASGIPVIAGEAAALAEIMGSDECGVACPGGSTLEFAQAARRLAADPQWARRLGEAGRRRVEQRFTEASCVARYLALFARLAAQAGRPG